VCSSDLLDKDAIVMSKGVLDLMGELKDFNYRHIYNHPEVEGKARKSGHILGLLYSEFIDILKKSERGKNTGVVEALVREAPGLEVFFHFIKNTNYNDDTPAWRIAADYIAGMTDHFAEKTYIQLFVPTPVI
jgi:dGTP triphosphohydrolase